MKERNDPERGLIKYQDPFMDMTLMAKIDSYNPSKVV
jgi:hypothetical protein